MCVDEMCKALRNYLTGAVVEDKSDFRRHYEEGGYLHEDCNCFYGYMSTTSSCSFGSRMVRV